HADVEAVVPCRVLSISAPGPYAEAFRSGKPAWLGSPAVAEASFRAMKDVSSATRDRAWAVIPLFAERGPIGVMGLRFEAPQSFGEERRAAVSAVAEPTARALERAIRHDEESDARTFQHRLIGIAGHGLRNPLTVALPAAEQPG